MRTLLRAIGLVVSFVITCVVAMLIYLGYQSYKLNKVASAIKPGMTIDQAVAAFPSDFFTASIGLLLRTESCKNADGSIVPPEQNSVLFPDMADGDEEGEKISWDARQLPMQFDRIDLLDQHLRRRKDWKILVDVWTSYIQDKEGHAEPAAFYRRGTAYLELKDFNHGFADLKTACKSGSKDACKELATLPREKVSAFEAEQRRIASTAPACEPPLSSFSLRRTNDPDRFSLQVYPPQGKGMPTSTLITRAELAERLKQEFANREWRVGFTCLTATPQHLSFHFVVGRDGKVKEVSPVRGWD